MASLRALLTAMMLIGATAADADDDDGIAPPVAHLTDSTGADLIAFKLACPSCAASKSELLLGDTCEPAFNPLQIDSSSAFSEMGTFSLAPGEYAEITTINPAGPAKSCLNTMDGCQTELRASYHYVDAKGVSRNYDGAPIKSGESLFPSLIPADASKSETQAQGPGLGDRKRGHWMYAGGVSDTTRTFGVAAKSSAGNCAEGLRMRIKKHKVTTQATSSASKQQGVLCTDVTSAGLDGSATIAPEETPIVAKSSYINVSTMVRRKFPNASAIRYVERLCYLGVITFVCGVRFKKIIIPSPIICSPLLPTRHPSPTTLHHTRTRTHIRTHVPGYTHTQTHTHTHTHMLTFSLIQNH